MALNPVHLDRDARLAPLPRRRRERVAGGAFQAVTRVVGLRPEMIPDHLRRQLRLIGITDEQVARVLPKLRTLAAWPYAWEAEGDARFAERDHDRAFSAYYVAQRILLAPSPLKRRLYRLAVDAYARIEQPELERLDIPNERGDKVAGYLQLPGRSRTGEPVPCVLMVPGIGGTKEELHEYAMPLLRRGLAVARIDNPIYGETEGILDEVSVPNARSVLAHLAGDSRLDPGSLHLHGMSLGANFALQSALGSRAATLTLICPPFQPSSYFRELPTMNMTALQHMTHRRDLDDLMAFVGQNDLPSTVARLDIPMRVFHGGRDRTIPVSDSHDLVAAASGPIALTVFERDHHNCLEHVDEITADTLEFLADPHVVCARHAATQVVDAAASTHLTDLDAALAEAGIPAARRRLPRARIPFRLRSLRPQRGGAAP